MRDGLYSASKKGRPMKRIKEVCELAGVSKRTLQFYDDEGLLVASRTDSNERVYSDESLERLWRIMLYKQMRFKLSEIKELINLSEQDQQQKLKEHINDMKAEVINLKRQIDFSETVHRQGIPPVCCAGEPEAITYQECLDVLDAVLNNANEIVFSGSNTGKLTLNGRKYDLSKEFADWLAIEMKENE